MKSCCAKDEHFVMLRYSEASAFLVVKRRSFASTLRMTTLVL
jgi:hypothetical protein